MNDLFSSELDSVLARLASLVKAKADAEAIDVAENALARFPHSVKLVRMHAVTLNRLDRRAEALRLMYQAEKLNSDDVDFQCDLASMEIADGRAGEAIKRMRAVLRNKPGSLLSILILGDALMTSGRYQQAHDLYSASAENFPDDPTLQLRLAAAELEIDHPEQSATHAKQAIRIAPQMAQAHTMLGHAYRARGQYAEALQAYGRAEQLEPTESKHAYQIGLMLDELGRLEEAEKAYARAVHLDHANGAALSQQVFTLRRLYRWDGLDLLSTRLRQAAADGVTGIMPFSFLAEDVSAEEQLRCAKNFAAAIENQTAAIRQRLNFKHVMPAPDTPIRIGFVSDGFGEHPTGMLTVAMLEALQSSDLEIHFYATAPSDKSPVRKRLENVGKMHQIHSLNHAAQAQRIHYDKIEVLIDPSVYCEGVNAKLFALRPAPLQVNWLGYPGSSGAPWLDYMLADKVVQPDHLRSAVSEKLVRLSRCFQPSDTARIIQPAPSRESCGLPDRGVVFACFNTNYKINPKVFGLFLSILAQTPHSVLWLLSSSEAMDQCLIKEAEKAGISADRLIFMPRLAYADYLSRYEHVDLFLDTSPHNARMPAYDALSAGCPVLTCVGETFASRITTSMLMHVDLAELVAEDDIDFVALAVSLGGNHEALQLLRHHLVQQRAVGKLFDMDGYAADFRRAVQAMVARRRIGRPVADIDIS